MLSLRRAIWLLSACSVFSWAQSGPPEGRPARVVVTIGHIYGGGFCGERG